MNIIKFNSIQQPGDELYNSTFRDQYCYAVNWKWAVPFNIIDIDTYISLEMGAASIDVVSTKLDISQYETAVDENATTYANNISRWVANNEHPISGSISIDELKRFRTTLAQYILDSHVIPGGYDFSCYTDNPQMIIDMLSYYAGGMENCTTKSLALFTNTGVVSTVSTGCGCNSGLTSSTPLTGTIRSTTSNTSISMIQKSAGCGCGSATPIYATGSASVCDPLATYRVAIYNYMTTIFSDLNFWSLEDHHDICVWMKSQVDEIIRLKFVLASYTTDRFQDCTCTNPNSDEQARLTAMLSALSTSLGYIIDNQVAGNRNFITQSFSNWALYLYEKMYWV